MFAQAIMEGFDKIIIHGTLVYQNSIEYYFQKSCLDFWYGVAKGRGIKVDMAPSCLIGVPESWCSGLYGYMKVENFSTAITTFSHLIRKLGTIPMNAYWSKDFQPKGPSAFLSGSSVVEMTHLDW